MHLCRDIDHSLDETFDSIHEYSISIPLECQIIVDILKTF